MYFSSGQIFDVNGYPIHYHEWFDVFENHRCQALSGKPKILFFQACRGGTSARIFGLWLFHVINSLCFQPVFACSALLDSVRQEFAPMSEIDAYQSDAPSHPTSRHADFVIAWPTVEGKNLLQHILVIDSMYT